MPKKDLLFERIFASQQISDIPILSSEELPLARYIYDIACDEIHKGQNGVDSDSNSKLDLNGKMEFAVENFERILEHFEKLRTGMNTFVKSFERWSTLRQSNILSLYEIARKIEKDKFNTNIAKLVGGVVTVIGGVTLGLSFLTPLAVVSVPLTIGGGVVFTVVGGVVVGTKITKKVLSKIKLKEAKLLVMQDEASFTSIAPYFTQREELKKAIHSLIGYNLFKDIFEILVEVEVKKYTDDFEEALKRCIKKMRENCEIINTFGVMIAPAVMAFVIVVCLLRKYRIVIECTFQTDLSMMKILVIEEERKSYRSNEVATSADLFRIFDIIFDSINVVLYSMDIYFRPESKHAIEIRNSAVKLQNQFSMIECAYTIVKRLILENSL